MREEGTPCRSTYLPLSLYDFHSSLSAAERNVSHEKVTVKQSVYMPWRQVGGVEVYLHPRMTLK